jgi:hypothetical protein
MRSRLSQQNVSGLQTVWELGKEGEASYIIYRTVREKPNALGAQGTNGSMSACASCAIAMRKYVYRREAIKALKQGASLRAVGAIRRPVSRCLTIKGVDVCMDFEEVVRKRRSIRSYGHEPVILAQIRAVILSLGRLVQSHSARPVSAILTKRYDVPYN